MADEIPDSIPYRVEEEKDAHAIVRFGRLVDHPRTAAHDEELRKLMERTLTVVCDFGGTEEVTSEWLRFLADLTSVAEEQGKRVTIVRLHEDIREGTVDALALRDRLRFYDSRDEALRA